jgi:HCOMODA/2-hydroxy-3-carboxy-muconic semialdehyde decarboxylase
VAVDGTVSRAILEDLAAANRILADQSVLDAAGHVTMRHPGRPDRYLMSRALAPALVTADDIMEFTLDSESCDAHGRTGFLERFLHGEIYRQRADVMAVAHGHAPSLLPFSLADVPLRATYHSAAFLAAGVPVFDIRERFGTTDIIIGSADRGAALAETLGDKAVVLLRAHGFVAVGSSLQIAVFRAVFAEISARVQLQAMSLGSALAVLDPDEGRMADALNVGAAARAWDVWKKRVMP